LELSWINSNLINGDLVSKIKGLKEGKGSVLKVIVSGDFGQTLFRNDLVNDLLLMIFPVTLGKGKRLFD
jgi:dihydrofolate reductase